MLDKFRHKTSHTRGKSLLSNKLVLNKRNGLIFIAIFAVVGASLLVITRAATSPTAFEPETGTLAAGATSVANANASGGRVLAFAGAATPAPTPAPTATPMPTSSSMMNPLIYGTGIGFDVKSNVRVNSAQHMAVRFKASTSSTISSIRLSCRTGTNYSEGNGGTMTVSIQADSGGNPSGTRLAQGTVSPGGSTSDVEKHLSVAMTTPPAVIGGNIYWVVAENPSATNWFSWNHGYVYPPSPTYAPRQPIFDDTFGLKIFTSSWPSAMNTRYLPVIDIVYGNGLHDGQSYYSGMINNYATISGTTSKGREVFTVSGGNRTVSHASVRLRRSAGTSPLIVTLQTAAGTVLGSGSVPASSIPVAVPIAEGGSGSGGSAWVTVTFAPVTLVNGTTYHLVLSVGVSGTTYTTAAIRSGGALGYGSYHFADGKGQYTTNATAATPTWTDLYQYDAQDLQFYFSK